MRSRPIDGRLSLRHALIVIALSAPATARADGMLPHSVRVVVRPGSTDEILLSSSIGLMLTGDGGEAWHWVCAEAIGYVGPDYHPDYAWRADGAIFATTFEGLGVSRDGGCTFTPVGGVLAGVTLNGVEIDGAGGVWALGGHATGPNDVWRSSDGVDFQSAGLVDDTGWWQSLASSDGGQRVYVTGYRRMAGDTPPAAMMHRSLDGGSTWEPLPTDDFDFGEARPFLYLLGASASDPDLVFARAAGVNPPLGDAIYRSTDGGISWARVLDTADQVTAFLIRADGVTVIVGTANPCAGEVDSEGEPADKGCVRISHDAGVTFARPASEPRMGCLAEDASGVLYSCGDNWDPDRFALGRSDDGVTWTPVVRFADIDGPLLCPPETEQAIECAGRQWPALCEDLGICTRQETPPDAGPDPPGEPSGCCRVGASPESGAAPVLVACAALLRRRRRVSGDRPTR